MNSFELFTIFDLPEIQVTQIARVPTRIICTDKITFYQIYRNIF